MLDEDEFHLAAVHFQYPAPDYKATYKEIFGDNLHFEQQENKIVFPAAVLGRPSPRAQPYVRQILIKHATELLVSLPSEQTFSRQVQEKIIEGLPWGPISVDKVAADLNMSRQTLYRRLKEEDTSFQELTDQARKELAATYLKTGAYTISPTPLTDSSKKIRYKRKWTAFTANRCTRDSPDGGAGFGSIHRQPIMISVIINIAMP